MEGVKIACGQITWGFGPNRPPLETILAEIARAGYEGAPAGRPGEKSAKEALELYARFGLKPAPGFLAVGWETPTPRAQLLEQAAQTAEFSRELGLTEVYVSAHFPKDRMALAAKVTAENATSTDELKALADLLNEIGVVTLKSGVSICFHNHVGTPVETRDEIDRLFAHVDRSVVFQGADIGHLAWAGGDAVQFVKDYAGSIKTLHIKDINSGIRAQGIAEGWDYMKFNLGGIFAELGEGMVDYPSMFEALAKQKFAGWIVVETDVTTKASALESATISRTYLSGLGL